MSEKEKEDSGFFGGVMNFLDDVLPDGDKEPVEKPTSDAIGLVREILTAHQKAMELISDPLNHQTREKIDDKYEKVQNEIEERVGQACKVLAASRRLINLL